MARNYGPPDPQRAAAEHAAWNTDPATLQPLGRTTEWDWDEWQGIDLEDGSEAKVRVHAGRVQLAVTDTRGRESVITLTSAPATAIKDALEEAAGDAFAAEHPARRHRTDDDRRDDAEAIAATLSLDTGTVPQIAAALAMADDNRESGAGGLLDPGQVARRLGTGWDAALVTRVLDAYDTWNKGRWSVR